MGLQVFASFFKPKTIKLDVLRKNPQARFPAGLGSACLREKYFSNSPGSFRMPFFFWDNRYDLRPRNNFVFQRPRLISIWNYEIRPNDLRIIIIYPESSTILFVDDWCALIDQDVMINHEKCLASTTPETCTFGQVSRLGDAFWKFMIPMIPSQKINRMPLKNEKK